MKDKNNTTLKENVSITNRRGFFLGILAAIIFVGAVTFTVFSVIQHEVKNRENEKRSRLKFDFTTNKPKGEDLSVGHVVLRSLQVTLLLFLWSFTGSTTSHP